MSTDLKPCPFCGGAASAYPDGDMEGHSYRCWNTACEMSTFGHATDAEAIAAWNRRAASSDAPKSVMPSPEVGGPLSLLRRLIDEHFFPSYDGGLEWSHRDGVTLREVDSDLETRIVTALATLPAEVREPAAPADARDAARYRWLREQAFPWGSGRWLSYEALDDACDAALQGQGAAP